MKWFILLLAIAILPFAIADDCNILCYEDNSCTEQECNSYGCILCDPYTCAESCEYEKELGKTCNEDSQCISGHCSRGKRAVSYQKACCPAGTQWDYLKRACINEDGNVVFQAEDYEYIEFQQEINEEFFEELIEELNLTKEETFEENLTCYPWEILNNKVCVLECPTCDRDDDGYQDQVEVRYYANPIDEEDKPFKRLFQPSCPDYFNPSFSLNDIGFIFIPFDIWSLLKSTGDFPSSQLGRTIGLLAGVLSSLKDDVLDIKDMLKLILKLGIKLVTKLIQFFIDPAKALSHFGYEVPNPGELLGRIKQAAKQVLQELKNDWYDKRSESAREVWDFSEECDNVILTKTYTAYYAPGYAAAQIAMLLVPGAQAKALTKLSKLSKLGIKVTKAAKLFNKVDWLRWMEKLPDEKMKDISRIIGKLVGEYGEETVKKIAKSELGQKIFQNWDEADINLLAKIVGDSPKMVNNANYFFEKYGGDVLKRLLKSNLGKTILDEWSYEELQKLGKLIEESEEVLGELEKLQDKEYVKELVMEKTKEEILILLQT